MKKLLTILLFLNVYLTFSQTTKTTIANGNWNNASIWSPSGVPTSTNKVKILHNVVLNTNYTCTDTIFVEGSLSINQNITLTLSGTKGLLYFVGNSTSNGRLGTVGNSGSIVGNVISQRYVNHCDGTWSLIGTPNNTTLGGLNLLMTGFTGGYYYPTYTWVNTYFWKEQTGYSVPTNTTNVLARGKGIWYWYSSQKIGNGSPASSIAQYNFPRTLTTKGSVNLTTAFNYSVTITSTSTYKGYNLISNPYYGTIDWDSNGWTKTNISSTIYIWNGCTGSYMTYRKNVGVNGGTRYLSSYQAFYIRTVGNSPSLLSNSSVLVNNNASFYRLNTLNLNTLYIKLDNDEIAVLMDSIYSVPNDPIKEGLLLVGDSTRLSSHFPNDNIQYAILSIKDSAQTIPLQTKKSGTLYFNGASSFNNYTLYLKDKTLNTLNQITDGYTYSFSESQTNFIDRFEITFFNNISTNQNNYSNSNIKATLKNNHLEILNPMKYNIIVTDIIGRKILESNDDIISNHINEKIIILYANETKTHIKLLNID